MLESERSTSLVLVVVVVLSWSHFNSMPVTSDKGLRSTPWPKPDETRWSQGLSHFYGRWHFSILCLPFLTCLSRSCKKLVILRFLQKFFAAFPQYQNTNFFVFGESYAGQFSFPPWYCGGEPCSFAAKLDLARSFSHCFRVFCGWISMYPTRIQDQNSPRDVTWKRLAARESYQFHACQLGKVFFRSQPGHYVPAIGHRIWSGNKARGPRHPTRDTAIFWVGRNQGWWLAKKESVEHIHLRFHFLVFSCIFLAVQNHWIPIAYLRTFLTLEAGEGQKIPLKGLAIGVKLSRNCSKNLDCSWLKKTCRLTFWELRKFSVAFHPIQNEIPQILVIWIYGFFSICWGNGLTDPLEQYKLGTQCNGGNTLFYVDWRNFVSCPASVVRGPSFSCLLCRLGRVPWG